MVKYWCLDGLSVTQGSIDLLNKLRIGICWFSYTQNKIQYQKYKLKCYIMKKESLSVKVSYINAESNWYIQDLEQTTYRWSIMLIGNMIPKY